ncbi:MAG: CapA family protein [Oscillospiraceae bacterium]|nr:CapA family protein [Oscillospiraceae bacterium]
MRISFCGDVCPAYINETFLAGDVQTLFHDVPQEFAKSDRVVVNLECALTDGGEKITKIGPNLKATPKSAEVLAAVGVTDCSISNNHIFDWGTEGALDTIKAVEAAGMNYTGFGMNELDSRKNLIIEKDGIKVAVISVCEHEFCYALPDRMGARPYCPYDTMEDIRKAKADNDYVVVCYHGGKEHCLYPSPRLRKLCQAMVKNGADAVLCQHSHCIGCYEEYEGGHIVYGQGNFHFAGHGKSDFMWDNGLMVNLEFGDGVKLSVVPVMIDGNGIRLTQGADKEKVLEVFRTQSAKLQDGTWIDGWRAFCEDRKPVYHKIISRAYVADSTRKEIDYFAHYLYCEAHHDVWQEVCKLSWETRATAEGKDVAY